MGLLGALPLPLGEGRGEGLVRAAENEFTGLSPSSRRVASELFKVLMLAKNSETDCGLKPAATLWFCNLRLGPHPNPLPGERESKRTTTPTKVGTLTPLREEQI